jgi:hypothetical protein
MPPGPDSAIGVTGWTGSAARAGSGSAFSAENAEILRSQRQRLVPSSLTLDVRVGQRLAMGIAVRQNRAAPKAQEILLCDLKISGFSALKC